MITDPAIQILAFTYFVLWILYFLYFRNTKWGLLFWFPLTAACVLIVVVSIIGLLSLGSGGGEAEGWHAYGVVMVATMFGLPSAVLLVISIWFCPRDKEFSSTVITATALCVLLPLSLLGIKTYLSHRARARLIQQNQYLIRLHLVDDAGVALSEFPVTTEASTDSNGTIIVHASKLQPLDGYLISWKGLYRTKELKYAYTYSNSPSPHISADYVIVGHGKNIKTVHKEYPYQTISDITVVLEREAPHP